MLYCTLGRLSSKTEESDVVAAIEARRLSRSVMKRVAEFSANLDDLNNKGFAEVSEAWIRTNHPNLVIFTGKRQGEEPTTRGGARVFAAVELDYLGHVRALIKLAWDYLGEPDEWANNCTDAVDRFVRGTRVS